MSSPAGAGDAGTVRRSSATRAAGMGSGMCRTELGAASGSMGGMWPSPSAGAQPMPMPKRTSRAPAFAVMTMSTMRDRGRSTSSQKSAPREDSMFTEEEQSRSTRMVRSLEFSATTMVPASSFHADTQMGPIHVGVPCTVARRRSALDTSRGESLVGWRRSGCDECAAATKRRGSVEASWLKHRGMMRNLPSCESCSSVVVRKACSDTARLAKPTTCRSPADPASSSTAPVLTTSMPRSSSVRAPVPPRYLL
mmetsp:Transcript_12343/g.36933  ORF Transcript_12343/g.36933 Transcript_12343/m.36933 type:complete len:252 (-) Transcript_12343:2-757(-)